MNPQNPIARIARWHLLFGLAFAVLGMGLGIYMATTQNHAQHPTHAHILLLGFVASILYAAVYRLWLAESPARTAVVQTLLHEVGATALAIGLFLLFGGTVPESKLEPVLATGSLMVLAGALLMFYQVLRLGRPASLQKVEAVGAKAV